MANPWANYVQDFPEEVARDDETRDEEARHEKALDEEVLEAREDDEESMEEEHLTEDPLDIYSFNPDLVDSTIDFDEQEDSRLHDPNSTEQNNDAGEGPSRKKKKKQKDAKTRGIDAVETNQNDLFLCKLVVYKREFKGQTSGAYVARWEISASSTEQFLSKVWTLANGFLLREVIFEADNDGNSTPKWSPKEKPSEDDFNRFALFQSARRYYKVEEIKSNHLQSWRDKEISLYLHVYSLSVGSRSIWNTVKESLIDPADRDRAGASTTQALQELTEELRSTHGNSLQAHDMAWSFWANAIQSAPAHTRSTMKNYPPQTLASLFKAKEGARINAVRRELETAGNVSDSYHSDIVTLRKTFDSFRAMVTSGLNDIDQQIQRLEVRDQTSCSLINSMRNCAAVEEDEVGRSLRKEVSDCPDVDHL